MWRASALVAACACAWLTDVTDELGYRHAGCFAQGGDHDAPPAGADPLGPPLCCFIWLYVCVDGWNAWMRLAPPLRRLLGGAVAWRQAEFDSVKKTGEQMVESMHKEFRDKLMEVRRRCYE